MVRAPACHAGGRRFKSGHSRHTAVWHGAVGLVKILSNQACGSVRGDRVVAKAHVSVSGPAGAGASQTDRAWAWSDEAG